MQTCLSDEALRHMLAEDVPYGDLTTDLLRIGTQHGAMMMCARRAMRVCGTEEAARLVVLAGGRVSTFVASGREVCPGEQILVAQGSVAALQVAWKTAQTLIEYLSGIASCAAEILRDVRDAGYQIPLACTRKNFPGSRELSAKAVRAGGAIAHRLGLSETLLVFPDHRVFVDKINLPGVFAQVHRQSPEKKLVAEAQSMDDALWLAECGADVLQLERFTPEMLQACRSALAARHFNVLLAPAGGVHRANAVAFAQAGADFLVSSAPYFAAPCDVQVCFERIG